MLSFFGWLFLGDPPSNLTGNQLGPLLTYGLPVIANSGVGILLLNLDYLLIGHYLGAAALGVYTLGFRMPELLVKEIQHSHWSCYFSNLCQNAR